MATAEGDATTTDTYDASSSTSSNTGCPPEVLPVWLVTLAAICGASIALLLASIVFMSCYFCHKFNAYEKYKYNDHHYQQQHHKNRYSNVMNPNVTNMSQNNNNLNHPISRTGGPVQVHRGIEEMMIDTKDLHPHQRNLHSPHRRYMLSSPYLLPNNTNNNNSQNLQTSTFGMFSSKNIQLPHHPAPILAQSPYAQHHQRQSQHQQQQQYNMTSPSSIPYDIESVQHHLRPPAPVPHQNAPSPMYQQKYSIDEHNPYDVHNTFLNSFTKGLTMSNAELDKSKRQIISTDFVQQTREDFSKALGNGATQYILTPVFPDTMSKIRKEPSQNKTSVSKKQSSVSSPVTTAQASPTTDPQSRIPKQYSDNDYKMIHPKSKNHFRGKTKIPRSSIASNSNSQLTMKSDIELEPTTSEEVAAVPESLLPENNHETSKFKGRVTPATEMNQWLERNRYSNKSYASTAAESDCDRTASTSTNTPTNKSIPSDLNAQEVSDYEYEFDGRNSITPDLTKQKMQSKSPQDVLNTTKDLLDWLELKIDNAKTPVGERSEWSMPRTSVSPKALQKSKKKKKQDLEATFDSLGSK